MTVPAPDMPTPTPTTTRSRRRPAAPAKKTSATTGPATPRPSRPAEARPLLAEALGRRLEALAGHLYAALDGDERGIHQARVATRRLREILPVVADTRSALGGRLRRRLKRLTRTLGPVRELDVAVGLLNARAAGRAEPAVVALRAHLTERRLAALDALQDACDSGRAKRLLEGLTDLLREIERAGRRGRGELPGRERRRLARRVIDRAVEVVVLVEPVVHPLLHVAERVV